MKMSKFSALEMAKLSENNKKYNSYVMTTVNDISANIICLYLPDFSTNVHRRKDKKFDGKWMIIDK